MDIEIITKTLELNVYGFSGIATNGDYAGTAFKLMDKMWQSVNTNRFKNEGKNIWIYEHNDSIFAGVELKETPKPDKVLEHKSLTLTKYAYYKHIGSYSLIKQVGQSMKKSIRDKGNEVILPYIEVYGHWSNDESKLETELFMCLK